ncbi:MAG: hypothetical protein DMD80_20880 [Candidatus Rokuibacteriota bacterium]|nr:MAG: hypothetical protein DMD80_20880 [Candidatus Rokubacteria bacterium]
MTMSVRLASIAAASLSLVLGLAWGAPVQAASFGGRAVSALVNLPGLGSDPIHIVDTGELAADGGWEGAGLLSTNVPDVLTADALVANTSGGLYDTGARANSSTSLAGVSVFPGNAAQLTASLIRAQVEVSADGLLGSTEVRDLVFAGVPITVTGQPNQKVEILGVGTLTINEQTRASGGSSQTLTVSAVHLKLATGEEVVLSTASSTINW